MRAAAISGFTWLTILLSLYLVWPLSALDHEGTEPDPARDPFVAPVAAAPPSLPLLQIPLDQLCLVALLWGIEPPHGVLQDEQGMGYIVRPGMAVGDRRGWVTAITPQRLIIEEPGGPSGNRRVEIGLGGCPGSGTDPRR